MSENDRELDALARDLARYRAVAAPAALRARVHAEIMAAPVPSRAARASWLGALRPLLAALLVVAVLAAAGGSAAAGSLPGDPAFAIKRVAEDAQVALTPDEAARLDVLTGQLDRRLAELETIAASRPTALDAALAEYAAGLARLERQLGLVARQGSTPARDAAMARASVAADAHIARLRDLAATLPPTAQPGIDRAIDAQQRIHGDDRAPASPARPGTPPGAAPPERLATPRTDRSPTPTRR